MRLLCLSDLQWSLKPELTDYDMKSLTSNDILNDENFRWVKYYYELVIKYDPKIVLFAGDLTTDAYAPGIYINSLIALLVLIRNKGCYARYIWGNHDSEHAIKAVNDFFSGDEYIKELSLAPEEIKGHTFAGLSYSGIRNKSIYKKNLFTHKCDFFVTHAPMNMRLNLFFLDVNFIISGHFDSKVIKANNSCLISLSNDSPIDGLNFAVIECLESSKYQVDYHLNYKPQFDKYFKFQLEHKSLTLLYESDVPDSIDTWYRAIMYDYNNVDCKAMSLIIDTFFTKLSNNDLPINSFEISEWANAVIHKSIKFGKSNFKNFVYKKIDC